MTNENHGLPLGPKTPAVWQLLRYSFAPLSLIEKCASQHGDEFTIRLAGYGPFVMLGTPEAVRDVFRGNARTLHAGEGNDFLKPVVGPNSVLVLDEEPHAKQRRAMLPPFKGERMRSFFAAMQSATIEASSGWPIRQPVGMLEPMQRITLQVMLEVVLGLGPGPKRDDVAKKVRRVLGIGRGRHGLVFSKLLPVNFLQTSRWLPFRGLMQAWTDALFAIVDERRQLPAEALGDSVLADLLSASHENGAPLDREELRDALSTLVFAGHDTTAVALAWALERIVSHNDVVEKIVDELDHVAGGGLPGPEHLDRLVYLEAAIRESLRTRTIMPFVVRLTKSPFAAGGREYPPGVVLCPCNHLVHRREDLYPDPQRFRPERFLERHYLAHEWFPFGGGGRMCIGMTFAMYEMKVVLSTLFATMRLERPPGARSSPIRRGIALAPADEAKMLVIERKPPRRAMPNARRQSSAGN